MLRVTSATSAGAPSMNWLTTNVSRPPTTAIPVSITSATPPPRGAPRRSRKSTAGISSAAMMVASATGTKITSSCLTSHRNARSAANRMSSRHAQAAALRTNGVTDAVGERIDTQTC